MSCDLNDPEIAIAYDEIVNGQDINWWVYVLLRIFDFRRCLKFFFRVYYSIFLLLYCHYSSFWLGKPNYSEIQVFFSKKKNWVTKL